MNLSSKIKELRQRDNFSQEALAARIYVTRQTVSNWETERSYPDVHSLLLLSVLFNVSLDELVKGDINMMKNKLEGYKMNAWSWVLIICGAVGIVSLIPLCRAFGIAGLIPSLLLISIAIIASLIVERLKKKNNIKTYSEVVAFVEGKPIDRDGEKTSWGRRHKGLLVFLETFGGILVGLILVLIGFLIEWIIFR